MPRAGAKPALGDSWPHRERARDAVDQEKGVTADILLPTLGVLALLLLFYDVLITVFHPNGRGGPINRTQNRLVWSLFRVLGRRPNGTVRGGILSLCGPFLAICTLAVWILLFILGFAAIYYPDIARFSTSSAWTGPLWLEAIYYSGMVGSTLGMGDVIAPTAGLRLTTILEAAAGFLIFAIVATYVLSIYRHIGAATGLAMDISAYLREDRFNGDTHTHVSRDLRDWVNDVARMLFRVTQAHAQHPVITYFYTRDPARALPVQIGVLIRLLRAAESRRSAEQRAATAASVSPDDATAADASPENATAASAPAADPSFAALRVAIESHLSELERFTIPDDFAPVRGGTERGGLEARHERILEYLLYRR